MREGLSANGGPSLCTKPLKKDVQGPHSHLASSLKGEEIRKRCPSSTGRTGVLGVSPKSS